MSEYVLDASAVLAYLNRESGWERVEALMLGAPCHLLSVNLAEVLTRLADWQVPVEQALPLLRGMEIGLTVFDEALALGAAQLRAPTRALGLSLGDRACLALAKQLDAVAVTADRPWRHLDPAQGIRIECIRSN